jgi:uncharacterized membrane protein
MTAVAPELATATTTEMRAPHPWRKPLLLALPLLLAGCSQTWVELVGPGMGDMHLYVKYGRHMAHGLMPYKSFFFDWPPGATVPVLLPALAGNGYTDWFHGIVFACAVGTLLLVAATLARLQVSRERMYAALAVSALLPCALGAISINSFDYWPALFTAGALLALLSGRDRLGLALLGLGIATKVYPAVLVPLALIRIARTRGRREAMRCFALCCGVVTVVALPFLIAAPGGFTTTTIEQLKRGLQMESLGASVVMALDHLGLVHVHVIVGKPYSLDVVGPGAGAVAAVSTLLVLAALAFVYRAYAAGSDDARRFVAAAAAAVAGWVAFNHVLSPQFLVWLFPLVPLVAGRLALGLLVASCLTTMTWSPGRFWELADVGTVSWWVLVRNVLLVGVFVASLLPLLRTRKPCRGRAFEAEKEGFEPSRQPFSHLTP